MPITHWPDYAENAPTILACLCRKRSGLITPEGDKHATTKKKPAPFSAAEIPGAIAASIPHALAPQLATLADPVPSHSERVYEIKLDGYRLLARFHAGKVSLITRRGNDWFDKMRHS